MGQDRNIINEEFKDKEEIDSSDKLKHTADNFKRKRGEKKKKGDKVQIWVKQKTLDYEKELSRLQVELLKLQTITGVMDSEIGKFQLTLGLKNTE